LGEGADPPNHLIKFGLSSEIDFGEGGPIEFELLTMARDYRVSWGKEFADLTELAKLRWGRKWTIDRIAVHLDMSYDSVNMRLRRLKRKNGCYQVLDSKTKRLIR